MVLLLLRKKREGNSSHKRLITPSPGQGLDADIDGAADPMDDEEFYPWENIG